MRAGFVVFADVYGGVVDVVVVLGVRRDGGEVKGESSVMVSLLR